MLRWIVALLLLAPLTLITGCGHPSPSAAPVDRQAIVRAVRSRLSDRHAAFVIAPEPAAPMSSAAAFPPGNLSNHLDPDRMRASLAPIVRAGSLGMIWLTGAAGPDERLMVQSTADATVRARLQHRADAFAPGRIAIIPGEYSEQALLHITDRALPFVSTHHGGIGLAIGAGGPGRVGRPVVVVSMPADRVTDPVVARLEKLIPPTLLQLEPVA